MQNQKMQNQISNGFRISPQQKRLWLLNQADKNNLNEHTYRSVYGIKALIKIEGNINAYVLKKAIKNVVERHEILRTTFHCVPGVNIPLQFINESAVPLFHDYDLTSFTSQEQEAKIDEFFQEKNIQAFDRRENTLLHIPLIKISSRKYVLLLSLPALCGDMATLNNLMHEISHIYTSLLHSIEESANESTNEPMQYADISEWLNELLESDDTETGRKYWQEQDFFSCFTLKLPFENQFSRKEEFKAQFKPQSFTLTISPDTLAKIEILVDEYNTSLSALLLTCWHILLWNLTEQSDVVVGTACNGRKYEELKQVFGLFIKYLPTNSQLNENLQFQEVLENVSKSVCNVQKWQDYFNWEQIAERITETNGNLAEPLFFPFNFDFEEQPTIYQDNNQNNNQNGEADVLFSIDKKYICLERFKVKLSCAYKKDSLLIDFDYDSSLFSIDNIKILCEKYLRLLQSIIKNPKAVISELEIYSNIEQQLLLTKFNETKTNYPKNKCFHQLFEEQVQRTPDNIAVVFENQYLTYTELNNQANQLAHHLQALGVGPEVLVAIYLERSPLMLVGLLGILKAGGAYIPLDPANPKERLALILSDNPKVLLTQQQLVESLPEHKATVVYLDSDLDSDKKTFALFAQNSTENPVSQVTSENLAYVIYTSGSTGKPKGTLIPHRGLVNYLAWCTQAYAVEEGNGSPIHSSISFDMTITGLFSPLLVGRKVELLPGTGSIDSLGTTLRNGSNYSLVKITPAHLEMLPHQISDIQAAGKTRAFIIGGENLDAKSTTFWQDFAPETILVNEYGPTETVVGCCTYQVPHGLHHSGSIPIGRPIANTQLYILDNNLKPVSIGVSGELYIGGDGLARGYLNCPDLTASRFIPNPFSNEPSARLYKTSDLVRYLPDGNIEYLGRIDNQVKIRGFRIELGEIEAKLRQHTSVSQSVVIVKEDVPGDKRLVAYIVPREQPAPTQLEATSAPTLELNQSDLRHFLKQQLPEYMIPSAFVILDALPLSANGKVNRSRLQAMELEIEKGTSFVAPRTPIEEILATIWGEILLIEQVGVHDNFFELGGHSLLATQLFSRVRATLAVELPLHSLFENPTISQFAECITTALRLNQSITTPPILPMTRDREIPLSFAQQRLWFLDHLESGNSFYNGYSSVRLEGKLNVSVLEEGFNTIIRRHEALRTNFVTKNGQPVQVIAETLHLTLPVVDLQNLSATEREIAIQQLAKQEVQQLFNIATEPLVRIKLLKLTEIEHVLIVCMHHIIADGWSAGILVQELAIIYSALCNNLPPQLPKLPIQYVDFAIWQRQWLQGEVLESQLAYWKKQLHGVPSLLKLYTDRPRPAIQTYQGARQSFTLSKELTEGLTLLSRREGVTLFMTLLAVYQILLYHYSGQDDISVGTPIANRDLTEIEGLIGFFTNTLVLRTNLSGDPSFKELMQQVREVALGAYAHQNIPFEKLVAELQPERNLSNMPLFQVWFVLQNTPMPPLELPGLTLSLLEYENQMVRYDLKLDLSETPEGIKGFFEYKTDLFKTSTIAQMAEVFESILAIIVEDINIRLSRLVEILDMAGKQKQMLKNKEFKQEHYHKLRSIERKKIRG